MSKLIEEVPYNYELLGLQVLSERAYSYFDPSDGTEDLMGVSGRIGSPDPRNPLRVKEEIGPAFNPLPKAGEKSYSTEV